MNDDAPLPPVKLPPTGNLTVTLSLGRPLVVVLWAAFVFISGAVTGASLSGVWRPPHRHGDRGPPSEKSAIPTDFARVLQRDHHLTEQQTTAIEQIIEKYQPMLESIHTSAMRDLDAELNRMNEEITAQMTAEQAADHMKRWRERGERRGPHPPPRREKR